MKIIDAHTHIGSNSWNGHDGVFSSPEESIDELRSFGISSVITAPWQATLCACQRDMDEGNAEALELHHKYPDFIYPGVVVDYRWPRRSLYWLETFRSEKLCWVGELVPKAGEGDAPFTHPAWKDIFDDIEEHRMILQLHNTSGTAIVAKAHPKLQVIGSHLNPAVLPEILPLPNVMLDISGLHGGLCTHVLQHARKQFGARRLLFGTDFEGYDPRCFIQRAQWTFTEDELPLLFHKNAEALLDAHRQ